MSYMYLGAEGPGHRTTGHVTSVRRGVIRPRHIGPFFVVIANSDGLRLLSE